jgi:predicted nuclease with TOPRIM domain
MTPIGPVLRMIRAAVDEAESRLTRLEQENARLEDELRQRDEHIAELQKMVGRAVAAQ